jgi:hypothetical protein
LGALYTIWKKDKQVRVLPVSRLTAMRQRLAYSAPHPHSTEQRMEIFLLLLDDLDDLFHAFRMSLPKVFGLMIALSLFGATVLASMRWPWLLVSGVVVVGVIASSRTVLRDAVMLRMKTDP